MQDDESPEARQTESKLTESKYDTTTPNTTNELHSNEQATQQTNNPHRQEQTQQRTTPTSPISYMQALLGQSHPPFPNVPPPLPPHISHPQGTQDQDQFPHNHPLPPHHLPFSPRTSLVGHITYRTRQGETHPHVLIRQYNQPYTKYRVDLPGFQDAHIPKVFAECTFDVIQYGTPHAIALDIIPITFNRINPRPQPHQTQQHARRFLGIPGRIISLEPSRDGKGSIGKIAVTDPDFIWKTTLFWTDNVQGARITQDLIDVPILFSASTRVAAATGQIRAVVDRIKVEPNHLMEQMRFRLPPHTKTDLRTKIKPDIWVGVLPHQGEDIVAFPAIRESEIERPSTTTIIRQIINRITQDLRDASCAPTKEQARVDHAIRYSHTNPLRILINPFDFLHLTRDDWIREINKFYTTERASSITIHILMKADYHSTTTNCFFINSISHLFSEDGKTRAQSLHFLANPISFGEFDQVGAASGNSPWCHNRSHNLYRIMIASFDRNPTYNITYGTHNNSEDTDSTNSIPDTPDHLFSPDAYILSYPRGTTADTIAAIGSNPIILRPTEQSKYTRTVIVETDKNKLNEITNHLMFDDNTPFTLSRAVPFFSHSHPGIKIIFTHNINTRILYRLQSKVPFLTPNLTPVQGCDNEICIEIPTDTTDEEYEHMITVMKIVNQKLLEEGKTAAFRGIQIKGQPPIWLPTNPTPTPTYSMLDKEGLAYVAGLSPLLRIEVITAALTQMGIRDPKAAQAAWVSTDGPSSPNPLLQIKVPSLRDFNTTPTITHAGHIIHPEPPPTNITQTNPLFTSQHSTTPTFTKKPFLPLSTEANNQLRALTKIMDDIPPPPQQRTCRRIPLTTRDKDITSKKAQTQKDDNNNKQSRKKHRRKKKQNKAKNQNNDKTTTPITINDTSSNPDSSESESENEDRDSDTNDHEASSSDASSISSKQSDHNEHDHKHIDQTINDAREIVNTNTVTENSRKKNKDKEDNNNENNESNTRTDNHTSNINNEQYNNKTNGTKNSNENITPGNTLDKNKTQTPTQQNNDKQTEQSSNNINDHKQHHDDPMNTPSPPIFTDGDVDMLHNMTPQPPTPPPLNTTTPTTIMTTIITDNPLPPNTLNTPTPTQSDPKDRDNNNDDVNMDDDNDDDDFILSTITPSTSTPKSATRRTRRSNNHTGHSPPKKKKGTITKSTPHSILPFLNTQRRTLASRTPRTSRTSHTSHTSPPPT